MWARAAGGLAILACLLAFAACGESDDSEPTTGEATAAEEVDPCSLLGADTISALIEDAPPAGEASANEDPQCVWLSTSGTGGQVRLIVYGSPTPELLEGQQEVALDQATAYVGVESPGSCLLNIDAGSNLIELHVTGPVGTKDPGYCATVTGAAQEVVDAFGQVSG